MKNLDRSRNQTTAAHRHAYHLTQQMEELASRRQQVDTLWQQLEAADLDLAQQKQEAAAAAALARQRYDQKSANLLQRLMNAIKSRNSMRGRLGNMTMQRNRAIRQVETLTTQNRSVMNELKRTTDRLGEAYQQISQIQHEYDQDMTELVRAYADLSLAKRTDLPGPLRSLLDQLEQDYRGDRHETTI